MREQAAPGTPAGLSDEAAAAFAREPANRTPHDVELVSAALSRDRRIKPGDWAVLLDPPTWQARAILLAHLDGLLRRAPAALPMARGVDEAGSSAPPTYLLQRGEYGAKGTLVTPAFPRALCAPAIGKRLRGRICRHDRRAGVRRWPTGSSIRTIR